jgi:hypothetical protein
MKKSHEEKCAEMRKRYKMPKKKKRPYVKRRSRLAPDPPPAQRTPTPPPSDPKDVIAPVKAQAKDFCQRNCNQRRIGHHVGCVFWLWSADGCLNEDS